MANRTNHWTKYIIDGVDYRDICKRNNIHEKQIDELQMKLEPEKCAVNELKGANQ